MANSLNPNIPVIAASVVPLPSNEIFGLFFDSENSKHLTSVKNTNGQKEFFDYEANSGGGTVTSVGLDLPSSLFNITNSPVTGSGILTGSFKTQTQNTFFSAPDGIDGVPSFRAITIADLPVGTGGVVKNTGGTLNYITKWTPDGNSIGNSQIIDDGTYIGVGVSPSNPWYFSILGITGPNLRVMQSGSTSFSTMEAHADYSSSQLRAVVAAEKAGNGWWIGGGSGFVRDTVVFGASNNSNDQDIFISVNGQTSANKIIFGWAAGGVYGAQANLDVQTGNFSFGNGTTSATSRIYAKGAGSTSATYTSKFEDVLGNAILYINDGKFVSIGKDINTSFSLSVNANVGGIIIESLTIPANPAFKIDVPEIYAVFNRSINTNGNGIIFETGGSADWLIGTRATSNNFAFYNYLTSQEQITISTNGGVGIGTAASPDASAILELASTTKGFAPPSMTGAQAEAIPTPKESLLIYATDGSGVIITSKGWWGFDGATWNKLN